MRIIKTIDLWTEQGENCYECFNGAFVDGFSDGKIPFDYYKIIKNCNCIITSKLDYIHIANKHNAICFYKDSIPVRLMVINKKTNIEKCIEVALKQYFNGSLLKDYYNDLGINFSVIDMGEKSIFKQCDNVEEIDVGSCDRWNLLYNMLRGSYTESDTFYGNFQSDKYEFIPDLFIKYELVIDSEKFVIEHKCGFINDIGTRLIPIQANSKLTS